MYCSINCSELWRKSIRVTLQDSRNVHYRVTCIRVRMRTFSPNDNESCLHRIRRPPSKGRRLHEISDARPASHRSRILYIGSHSAAFARSETEIRHELVAAAARS